MKAEHIIILALFGVIIWLSWKNYMAPKGVVPASGAAYYTSYNYAYNGKSGLALPFLTGGIQVEDVTGGMCADCGMNVFGNSRGGL